MKDDKTYSGAWAVRTWKRDGSTNRMPLESAAKNLTCYGVLRSVLSEGQFSSRLKLGETMHTSLAAFTLEGIKPEIDPS